MVPLENTGKRHPGLVQAVAAQKGMRNAAIDEVVKLVDAQLERNRRAKKAAA